MPFSEARPSRRKKPPGILPAAYIRSSTSTVSGKKSPPRGSDEVPVAMTVVSPTDARTAPPAWNARRPVSNLNTSLPIFLSTEWISGAMCLLLDSHGRDRLSLPVIGRRGADAGQFSVVRALFRMALQLTTDLGRPLL